jgi:Mn2+/Fe2+ NRAMP family transporter
VSDYPSWLLHLIVTLLFIANTINIGADLSSMADAARVLFGGRSLLYVLAFTAICVGGIVFIQYKLYVTFLKWLTLSLFAYVAAMFAAKVNWSDALSGVLLPRITWSNEYFTTLVAILGTTISPYLFFWQASQEAEDVHVDRRRKTLLKAPRQALDAFARIRTDTLLGMAFSNVIALAISSPQPQRFTAPGSRTSKLRLRRPKRSNQSPERLPSRCSQSASSAPGCSLFRSWRHQQPMLWERAADGR